MDPGSHNFQVKTATPAFICLMKCAAFKVVEPFQRIIGEGACTCIVQQAEIHGIYKRRPELSAELRTPLQATGPKCRGDFVKP
jgi:hypothetical protein